MTDTITRDAADAELVSGRWEPCAAFTAEVPDSQVCGACGWLHDDHAGDAVVRRLPTRAPRLRSSEPRRLAS
jgi:hypothetical protein